jgi:aconitate hydratase
MGVLPLQFQEGQSWRNLGLTGQETFDIVVPDDISAGSTLAVVAKNPAGQEIRFMTDVRLDSPVEVRYWQNGGILHTVLRDMAKG